MYYLLDIVGSYLLINLCYFYSLVLFFSLSSSMETLQRADSWPTLFPGMIAEKLTGWNLSILWKSG